MSAVGAGRHDTGTENDATREIKNKTKLRASGDGRGGGEATITLFVAEKTKNKSEYRQQTALVWYMLLLQVLYWVYS